MESKEFIGNSFEDDQFAPVTAEAFANSFQVEPKPAVVPGGSFTTAPPPNAAPADAEKPIEPEAPPIIPPNELDDEEEETPTVKKWSKEEREEMAENLEMMLNFRSIGQAKLLGIISGEDAAKYELNEEQMQQMARVYAPVMRKFGSKIPDFVWIILAEGIITTPLITMAIQDRQNNRANKQLALSEPVKSAVAAAQSQPTGERKNYSIDERGYYIKDGKSNAYLKIAKRTSKASFADIERILEDNELELVQSVFPELKTSEQKSANNFD